jgi:hypothetical protein
MKQLTDLEKQEIIEELLDKSDPVKYSDNVRKIAYDWVSGLSVNSEDYKKQYNNQELTTAISIILELVSRGL